MIKTQRPYFFFKINSRPVQKFKGFKTYVSTGDSENMENGEQVSFYNRPSRANVQPRLNDVIFAKMSNTDKTFLVDDTLSNYIFSTGFFDISSNNFEPRYLAYLIRSDEFDGYKNAYSEGTTQVSISDKRLKKIRVTYETDINKQKQIADFLDKKVLLVDKLIDIKKQEIEVLIKQKKDLITSSIKEAIDSSSLTDIKYFSTTNGRIGWQGLTTAEYKQEGPYLITGTDFNEDGSINYNTCVHITFKRYKEASKIQVRNGDVLITKDGTVGKVAIIDNLPCEASLNSGVLLIRPNTKKCLSKYLYYYLKSDYFWDWFKINSKEAATIVHLYQQQFNNFPVYLPSLSLQERIVSNLDCKYKKLEKLLLVKNLHLNELYNYKKSLIYEYISGKKEVPHEFN